MQTEKLRYVQRVDICGFGGTLVDDLDRDLQWQYNY